jgi:hypothetical protein
LHDASDGLLRFKKGWANTTRQTWLCGRICDRQAYDDLYRQKVDGYTDYFPAYRVGEFE